MTEVYTTLAGSLVLPGGPSIEMIPNPDFTFPRQSTAADQTVAMPSNGSSRRPASASMQLDLPSNPMTENTHRRAGSAALPSFAFNAGNTSGLQAENQLPTPEEAAPTTPSRRGHRRGGSEFVGGDSRFGVSNAVSSSPTKTKGPGLPTLSTGPPPNRRGHAHRRSAAISSHDVTNLINPQPETLPRSSTSLPNTPLEEPSESPLLQRPMTSPERCNGLSDPFGPPLDNASTRPPSRPRVGFAENVEYIPRPLSTISSETESSLSTVRGHSVNNSISSVLSLSTPSPPSSRMSRIPLMPPPEDESKPKAKSSLEISRRVEKEGEWLKSRSSGSLKRPLSESAMSIPKTTFAVPEPVTKSRVLHKKKHSSMSHALGFDRRRSEPAIGMSTSETSRLSTISLQESISSQQTMDGHDTHHSEHRSSVRKMRQWAASKMSRKTKDGNRALSTSSSTSSMRPESAGSIPVPGKVPITEAAVAETDLDAVFSSQTTATESTRPSTPPQLRIEINNATPIQHSTAQQRRSDDSGTLVDLDAALGPFNTPQAGNHRPRKELHSGRLNKDFIGPGLHYHRRSESAPSLARFDGRPGSQSEMADVFEEDEEEDIPAAQSSRPASIQSANDSENAVGIQIVDSDNSSHSISRAGNAEEALGIRGQWEHERPGFTYSAPRYPSSLLEGRGSSIIEETIEEEVGPGEEVEIVDSSEEPRASSLTKSSDSSETPTVMALPIGTLTLPSGQQPLKTPDTYQTSAFSSPDLTRRQGSFDTSRLGTSASSIADNRTISSYATGEHGPEHLRVSCDDVPSLTSSRSTVSHTNLPAGRVIPRPVDPKVAAERQKKRGSIQSLSQLMGAPFGPKSKGHDEMRPYTAAESHNVKTPKKEHRLRKLMFWKPKQSAKSMLRTA